jgi:hypothetical protein
LAFRGIILELKEGRVVGLAGHFDPRVYRQVGGGVITAALHVGLLLVILFGGGRGGIDTGDVPALKLVLIKASEADRRQGVDLPPLEPTVPPPTIEEQPPKIEIAQAAPPPGDPAASETIRPEMQDVPLPQGEAQPAPITTTEAPVTLAMSEAEKAALAQRLEQLAEASITGARAETSWQQDGKTYSAVLLRERANDGTALERVTAEVSASESGKRLTTLVNLNRLAFSQFTQMVDHWDPFVQLHDDEIVGRFHSNTGFNLMYDRRIAPKFTGKVTTSARSFNMESNWRRRDSDIFRGGVETRAEPIALPEDVQPFDWAPRDANARVHEIADDTHIRFFPDGSYTWRNRGSSKSQYLNAPTEYPVYFVGARGATLYVKGVVAGKILVYSPERIVIEGSLTYAHDPRGSVDAPDYLGLVCDRYIEVASPGVTGPGDLRIEAAIFAGRRFLVTDIDYGRSATLRIYGSLAAGTLSATEPRYATKIDYDYRFEHPRPPGFPSTNRFEVADWDGQWTERPEQAGNDRY